MMSMRWLGSIAMSLALLLSGPVSLSAAELSVQLDRQRLNLNDVLELRLIAEGELDGEPDFTPLSQDFDILRRGQSQMTSIVNGRISHSRQWSLQLSPKRAGRLTIPSIVAGRDRSDPLAVEVLESGVGASTATEAPKPLFVEAELETATPYVQQPVEYRVKVYYRQPPQRAVLSEPRAEGATLQRVGEDRGYDEYRDGLAYRVIERRYRLIPHRVGQILVESPRLEAMLEDPRQGARDDPFADLDRAFGGRLFQGFPTMPGVSHPGRRVVERASDVTLQARPIPASFGADWLPATSVQIADEWTPSPPVFQAGEPVTRTLTITAEGVTAAQLPNLDLGAIEGAQVYPDQPRGEDLADGATPVALKTLKFALVPVRPGALTLPEIRLHWWDTRADRARVVVVPARTVQVAPALDGVAPSAAPEPDVVAPSGLEPAGARSIETGSASPTVGADGALGIWPWLALLLAIGWGATLIWWRRERRGARRSIEPAAATKDDRPKTSLEPARRAVRAACLANDPRAARSALVAWARMRWPDLTAPGLESLGQRFDDLEARHLLRSIDRAIYAPPGESWDGASAWERLAPHLARSKPDDDDDEDLIPELYPD